MKTHIGLFEGVGGFSLAAEMNGMHSIASVEIDPFCQKVLAKNFPNSKIHGDVRTFDGTQYAGQCDLLTAGFPCQPFSVAGKQGGENDNRFLWPESIRVVREARPRWCIFENVPGLLGMVEQDSVSELESETNSLFSENEKTSHTVNRRIIGRIIEDIKQAGYVLPCAADGTPIIFVVPSFAVEAIHRRDRVWIVAYLSGQSTGTFGTCGEIGGEGSGFILQPCERGNTAKRTGGRNTVHADDNTNPTSAGRKEEWTAGKIKAEYADGCDNLCFWNAGNRNINADSIGLQTCGQPCVGNETGQYCGRPATYGQVRYQPADKAGILRAAYGVPGGMVRPKRKHPNKTIKAMGNAIVPQVAYHIIKAIIESQL